MEVKVKNLEYEFNNKKFKAKELDVSDDVYEDRAYIISTDDFYDELVSFMESPNDDLYDLANEYFDEIWYFTSDDEYDLPSVDLVEILDGI